jgi:hypothetical protein
MDSALDEVLMHRPPIGRRRRRVFLVHRNSERTVEPVRQDSSFAEK